MKKIFFPDGGYSCVDDEDYEFLLSKKWYRLTAKRAVFPTANYATTSVGRKKRLLMHRMIMNAPPGIDVDHVDGDGLNNQRSNLRLCTRQQNCMNRPNVNGRSKYKGVSWYGQTGKWRACIKINRKQISLGLHKTEEEAAVAYNNKAKVLFGDFAYLNEVT